MPEVYTWLDASTSITAMSCVYYCGSGLVPTAILGEKTTWPRVRLLSVDHFSETSWMNFVRCCKD